MLDLAIVGSGPAGITAAIYAARYMLNFEIIGQIPGGLVSEAHQIENYPGFKSITGEGLIKQYLEHLDHFGKTINPLEVRGIRKEDGFFVLATDKQTEIMAKTVLLAIGTERKKLSIPGEEEFLGKGVSYCATCDAMFFRNKKVAVIGGSDSAVTAAIYLADIAQEVHIIYRGTNLRAEPFWIKKAEGNPKIQIHCCKNLTKITGSNIVEKIELDTPINGTNELEVNGVFIEIGTAPNIAILEPLGVKIDEKGYIVVDNAGKTNVEGVWAAGDITTGSNKLRQMITAAAEGAVCAHDIYQTLKKSE
jgi:thioredoxin reductase (NADPH)